MIIYDKQSMVSSAHIKVIDEQLKNFGSKVPDGVLKDEHEHALANVLYLACGKGAFGNISLNDIKSIGNQEFNLSSIF